MSYKYTVLQDNPIAFYLLDEVRSGSVGDYDGIRSQFATYQDLKDNGVSYSAISGLPIYDYSGNLNDGYAINASTKELMPLISGGVRGTQILPTTSVYFAPKGIANKYYADNSFSIEAWVYAESSTDLVPVVADVANSIGLFFQNGNIIFKVGSYKVEAPILKSEASYVVGLFNGQVIDLYINGALANRTSVEGYKFINESVTFKSGPSDSVLVIDSVGFYKYNLSDTIIKKHYVEGVQEIKSSQIINLDSGYSFSMNVLSLKPKFQYTYPVSKTWSSLIPEGLSLSADKSYIYIPKTETATEVSYSFVDKISVPTNIGITTSQIYWSDDVEGITIEASLDGDSWEQCQNSSPIPYFNKNDNQTAGTLYLRVSMSSSDTTRYLPVLKSMSVMFFGSKNFYSDNSGYYITSDYDYSLPRDNSRALAYNKNNGLRMYDGHGFMVNGSLPTKALEIIFTPASGSNVLFSGSSKSFSWATNGAITKSGIASIYVNGINRTSETNAWDFLNVGLPHHIIINLISEDTSIKFNQNQDGSEYGLGSTYNNIAVYPDALPASISQRHYLMYTDNITNTVSDSFVTIQESSSGDDSTPFTVTSVEPESVSL